MFIRKEVESKWKFQHIQIVYLLIPYIVYWTIYPEHFAYSGVDVWIVLKDCLPIGIIGTVFSMISALGEEIGWRGFMVPALLYKLNFNKMLVISSLIWCDWHLPLLIAIIMYKKSPNA